MIHIDTETAQLIMFDEDIQPISDAPEYLLKTGAKLYPPKPTRLLGWRIVGCGCADLNHYIERYDLDDAKINH